MIYSNQSTTVSCCFPLLVVEGSGLSLFGRDWLAKVKLDWAKIFSIGVPRSNLAQETVQCLIKGIKAKIEVKQVTQPKF